jgi:hypothetical protein
MTRIDDQNPRDRDCVRETFGRHPLCSTCKDLATIWIRLGQVEGLEVADLFLCDIHAFHLARILMIDIGHPDKIVPYKRPI